MREEVAIKINLPESRIQVRQRRSVDGVDLGVDGVDRGVDDAGQDVDDARLDVDEAGQVLMTQAGCC